ncbi:MAG: hypothetical protein GOVbin4685_11 [Prokaryotic dsDNA virus sp.]|nr:MAG: hypothetical protein GOVbin4685_11 [Prokaryotic dsDNA virus sp.]
MLDMNRPSEHAGKLTNADVDAMVDAMDMTDEEWWAENGAS